MRKAKQKKGKAVNFVLIPQNSQPYEVLEGALQWHEELAEASIALAWRKGTKQDVDGHIVLGRCCKVSDLHKEFMKFDFVVVLNKEYWDQFDDKKRLALMDHELCHASASLDSETSEQKEDERGRPLWRVRKHDIEEFREVVERHGCYKSDLESFAKSLRESAKSPLFTKPKESIRMEHAN